MINSVVRFKANWNC